MAQFRDSRGRFSSQPRDSAGRWHSAEWYNRSQGQKRRYAETSQARAAAEYSARRVAEIAAEYEAAALRFEVPEPAFRQRQDAWGLLEIGRTDPGASVKVHIEFGGTTIYDFDGTAEDFAPAELKAALDEWSEEELEDKSHYWRAPGLRLWEINRWFAPGTVTASRIEVNTLPAADSLIQEAIAGEVKLAGYPMAEAPADPIEWPADEDALPE